MNEKFVVVVVDGKDTAEEITSFYLPTGQIYLDSKLYELNSSAKDYTVKYFLYSHKDIYIAGEKSLTTLNK